MVLWTWHSEDKSTYLPQLHNALVDDVFSEPDEAKPLDDVRAQDVFPPTFKTEYVVVQTEKAAKPVSVKSVNGTGSWFAITKPLRGAMSMLTERAKGATFGEGSL